MTANVAPTSNAAKAGPSWTPPPWFNQYGRPVGVAGLAALGVLLSAGGHVSGWVSAPLTALLCAWLARIGPLPGASGQSGGEDGARIMARGIVPVWQRHVEASRSEAERSVGALLESFAKLSGVLASTAEEVSRGNPSIGAGAVDEMLDRHEAEVATLLQPMEQALTEREQMLGTLVTVSDALGELGELARQIAGIAKHTNIVALNASIESHRAGQSGGDGFIVVANEVRTLAGRIADISERIRQRLSLLAREVDGVRRAGQIGGHSEQELRLQAQLQARKVVAQLLASMGDSLEASRSMRTASIALRDEIDQVSVAFQFQDRLSQMLGTIRDDMARFHSWMDEHDHASRHDVQLWLEALENTYTMEEQRAHHHGTVEVRSGSGVEFF